MPASMWSRRALLKSILASSTGAMSSRAATGLLAGLAGTQVAHAAGDYRALVCIFLQGGNDGFNLLVPSDDARYATYAASRGSLALSKTSLVGLTADSPEGSYGVHASCPQVAQLFNSGKLTFVRNVGTLLQPTTKADYDAKSNLPPNLFSHNDQQDAWSRCSADSLARIGWGGRLADLMSNANANTLLALNLSLDGTNLFQTGEFTLPYGLSTEGVQQIDLVNDSRSPVRDTFSRLLEISRNSGRVFEPVYGDLMRNTVDVAAYLGTQLESSSAGSASWPDTSLAAQLQMVARLISIRGSTQMSRQVFYCTLGGFDTHDDQLELQTSLLGELSAALGAFQSSLESLGVADEVVTFTMSDFGRTLSSNGDGSDHAWGNHHLVMGNAVHGGRLYGVFPDLTLDGPDDAGFGRVIPTSAVEQYGATLASWFGATADEIDTIFPNLDRFASRNLGFV